MLSCQSEANILDKGRQMPMALQMDVGASDSILNLVRMEAKILTLICVFGELFSAQHL